MKQKTRSRLYWRTRGGAQRAYADLRDFGDVGGKQEALIAPGEKVATADRTTAEYLIGVRLRELEMLRRDRTLLGRTRRVTLRKYGAEHLNKKAESNKTTDEWLSMHQLYLERAAAFFGDDRTLDSIRTTDVQSYISHLNIHRPQARRGSPDRPTKREPRPLSQGTVRHHVNVLSNLFARAISEGILPPGANPVAALMEKPTAAKREAAWLEIDQATLLLEAARTLPALVDDGHPFTRRAIDCALPTALVHALLAAHLLTGGRRSEVCGLEVDDVRFDRGIVIFRPNQFRRLKTLQSERVVPLWPQLAEILRAFVFRNGDAPTGLLFPSPLTVSQMIADWRKAIDRVAVRAGRQAGTIRSKMFRHTYCSARLQTLDHGAPVSPYTVSKELGHGSESMVKRVYAHLGTVRHRSEVVEYRVEQHRAQLADKLAVLQNA